MNMKCSHSDGARPQIVCSDHTSSVKTVVHGPAFSETSRFWNRLVSPMCGCLELCVYRRVIETLNRRLFFLGKLWVSKPSPCSTTQHLLSNGTRRRWSSQIHREREAMLSFIKQSFINNLDFLLWRPARGCSL